MKNKQKINQRKLNIAKWDRKKWDAINKVNIYLIG